MCMRRLIILPSIIFLFSSSVMFVQADEIGCCEIRQGFVGRESVFESKTETECKNIDINNGDTGTTFHEGKQASPDKKSCIVITEQGTSTRSLGEPIYFDPSVSIPESDFVRGNKVEIQESTLTLTNYIVAIFKYSTGVIGIIAAIALMVGGIVWLTAAGNHEKVSSAKTIIGSSLVGMCIAFSAFLLLSLVNTNLVNFKIAPITSVDRLDVGLPGCCKKYSNNPLGEYTTESMNGPQCEALKKQVGPEENQYHMIEFFPHTKAEDNDCVKFGCCEYVDHPAIKYDIMTPKQCEGRVGRFFELSDEVLAKSTVSTSCLEFIE